MEKFRISVRSLVEFLLHSGDIDGGKGGMADKEAMQLGSRIHRKIQGSMGAGYRPEVSLKAEIVKETFTLFVEGRADGILEQDGRITVDEIKGVYRSLDAMEKPDLLHLAQAKCYAAIYGSEQKLDVISVQMTYCNLETEEIRRFVQEFSVKELKSWFDELTEQYCKWCEMQVKWKTCRQESIHACVFPFPYREGQKQLAAAVYRTIAHRKKLFIQAPTGVGKTISTVFPTVKADQIGGSEYSFAEMDGMVFAGEEGAIAMTRWTEGKPFAVKTENIRLWEPQRFDVGGIENQKENEKNENIAERATAERVNAEKVTAKKTENLAADNEENAAEELHATEMPMRNIFPKFVWVDTWERFKNTYPYFTLPEDKNVECVRIELKDLRELPRKYWYLGNNSFLLHGFFNYRYLVLGKLEEDKWFIGVPGIYQQQERVMAAIFGFPEFMTTDHINQFGYWYHTLDE